MGAWGVQTTSYVYIILKAKHKLSKLSAGCARKKFASAKVFF